MPVIQLLVLSLLLARYHTMPPCAPCCINNFLDRNPHGMSFRRYLKLKEFENRTSCRSCGVFRGSRTTKNDVTDQPRILTILLSREPKSSTFDAKVDGSVREFEVVVF